MTNQVINKSVKEKKTWNSSWRVKAVKSRICYNLHIKNKWRKRVLIDLSGHMNYQKSYMTPATV